MQGLKTAVHEDYEALSRAAARRVAETLSATPDARLLLPTGSTPVEMYRELAALYAAGNVSFSRATIFNLDEYLGLAPEHPESYRRFMQDNLYRLVDADPSKAYIPDAAAPDPAAECERYEAAIMEAGGIDLCVLGIGRNGHIGFNEPGSTADSRTRMVGLEDSTRRANAAGFEAGGSEPGGIESMPEQAITVGLGTILDSGSILLLASGEGKADAVAAAVEGEVSTEVPASLLRRHPDVTLLLDREAASGLDERVA